MGLAETLNRAPFSLCFPDLCNPSHELRSVFSYPFSGMPVPVSKPWPLVPFPCIHRRSLAVPLHKGERGTLLHLSMRGTHGQCFRHVLLGLGHHRFWGLHRCRAQRAAREAVWPDHPENRACRPLRHVAVRGQFSPQ